MAPSGFVDKPEDIADPDKGVVMRATSGAEIVQLDLSVHHARCMYATCGDQGLRLNVSLPITIDEDNQIALDLICNPSKQWRSNSFIGIRWHIIRMEIQEGFA